MQGFKSTVRNLDLFAVPVSLTYKGKTKFNTLCGGFFSLLIILVFVAYAGLDMYTLIAHPVLRSSSEKLIVSSIINTDAFNIDPKVSTLAVQISG